MDFGERFNENRLIPMHVIFRSQLTSIVVSPRINVVRVVHDCDVSRAKCDMIHRVFKVSLDFRAVYAWLEEGSEPLDAVYQGGNHLKLLNEAISGPCAQGPAPEHHLKSLVEQCKILTIWSDNPINILVLKGSDRLKIFKRAILVLYAELALNI